MKFTHISLIAFLTLTLIGCDNASNNKVSTDSNNKISSQLDTKQQFRLDFEAFEQWRATVDSKINQKIKKLEEAGLNQELTPQKIEALISNIRQELNSSTKDLDTLTLKSPEIMTLASQIKDIHTLAIDIIDLTTKIINKSVDEQTSLPKLESQLSFLEQRKKQLEVGLNELFVKYNQR